MLVAITAALVTTAALGLWFNVTRPMALGAFALLCLLFPWLALIVVIGVVWAFFRFKVRKP